MTPVEAGRILVRLQGHWPSLATEDVVAQDWLRAIVRLDADHGQAVADRLIFRPMSKYPPTIANWLDAAQALAPRVPERRELRAAPDPEARARVGALVRETAAALDAKRDELGIATETPLQRAVRDRRRVEKESA